MAPSEVWQLVQPGMEPRDADAQMGLQEPGGRSGFGRNFGFLVQDVSRLMKRRFDRKARQMGLLITRQQAAVVLNIAANEGVSQAEVATWLGIEPIALVRMLDKLHEEGLVERRAHPTDRRVRTLWLTPAAGPVVGRILAINEAIRQEAFGGLSGKQRDGLISALGHIKDNLALQEEAACDGAHEAASGLAGG